MTAVTAVTALADIVGEIHRDLDADEAMKWLARLVEFDRYQGSSGIAAAADFVAGEAERVGLVDVEVLRFPADGRTSWWTFTAPSSWTPLSASLSTPGRPRLVAYPEQSYALAAGSAAASVESPLVLAAQEAWPPGAVVLVGSASSLGPELFARMAAERAAGFCVTTHPDGPAQAGRVELSATGSLFGFSVLREQMDELLVAHGQGERVRVVVEVDRTETTFPVVVARTRSGSEDELLLGAHLCHPAPGANDNASGVAAALAVGRVLAGRRLRRGVRFVWGPEFVGLAAYLHQSLEIQIHTRPLPLMAINLDMVGEDQRLCGGPLVIEQSPEYLPHFANAVVDACVRAILAAARSYSGAVGCDVWTWRTTPFVGASDHAILADRSIGCAAVQLGHWPDRFNHSSADTLDKVDPQELRRAATIAASALAVVGAADQDGAARIAELVTRWTIERMTTCLPPSADPRAALRMARYSRYGQDAVRSVRVLGAAADVLEQQAGWLDAVCGRLSEPYLSEPGQSGPRGGEPGPASRGRPLRRAWPGPFNLRALMAAVTDDDRRWFAHASAADRGGFYAVAMALAQSIDGTADLRQAVLTAELDSGLPLGLGFGQRFLAAMARAGWVVETDGS